jgi:hypothetical protein
MTHVRGIAPHLQPATGYRIETQRIALANGYFPGLLLERTYIGLHCVDGITFLVFQNANGVRHVLDAATIERIFPLGRPAMNPDALRHE